MKKYIQIILALVFVNAGATLAWGVPFTWKISVKDKSGGMVNGVTLTASGTAFTSTHQYLVNGSIDFNADIQGTDKTWSISVRKDGWDFTPLALAGVNTSDEAAQLHNSNYERSGGRDIYTGAQKITGYILDLNGVGVTGLTVALSGTLAKSCVTDSNGYYSLSDLSNGNYTVTPSGPSFCINPSSQNYTLGDGRINQNYVAFVGYTISGYVKNGAGVAIESVSVALAGNVSKATVTNSSGYYEFTSVPAGGNYSVTLTKTGYAFSPVKTYSLLSANQTNQDFSGGFDIKGQVKDGAGNAIAGTTLNLTGAASQSAVTDAAGYFEFTRLASGNYSVSPSKGGWAFSPNKIQYTGLSSCVDSQDFSGFSTITPSPTPTLVVTSVPTPTAVATQDSWDRTKFYFKAYNNKINPNRGERVLIRWNQPKAGSVTITVYNMVGDKIMTLVNRAEFSAGEKHDVFWGGNSTNGQIVGSGIYLVVFESAENKAYLKIAVIK